MSHAFLVLLFGFMLLPGIFMALIPMLPAFWYLLAAAALFAVIDGFTHLTAANLAALGGIVAVGILVDWSAGLLGAKFGGAAWKSLLYGAAGGVAGLLIFPPLGIFAGLFVGVFIGETVRERSRSEAARAAAGALLGGVAGIIINTALAIAFVVLFVVFAAS